MRLWLCILDGYNHNCLLQSSVSQQSWLLLHLLCQVCTFYGLVKQYIFFLATTGIFLLLLFKELYEYTVFSAPIWWIFFAFVWFPKISSLWSLTRSLLRTPFNCSHLCFRFAFASWHFLPRVQCALHIYLTIQVTQLHSEGFAHPHSCFRRSSGIVMEPLWKTCC